MTHVQSKDSRCHSLLYFFLKIPLVGSRITNQGGVNMKRILIILLICVFLFGCGKNSVDLEEKSHKEIIMETKELTEDAYDNAEYLVYLCDMYEDEHITKDEFCEKLAEFDMSLLDYQARNENKQGNFKVVAEHGSILIALLEKDYEAISEHRDLLAELIEFEKYESTQ